MKPSAVWDEPLIHTVPVPKPDLPNNNPDPVQNIPPVGSNAGDRGDILVRGLWSPGVETIIDVRLVKQIAKRLEKKWSQPYSVVRGFLNSRISLAIVRASHQCLRGPRNPSSKTSHRVQWLDGAGLGIYLTLS